MAWTTPRTWADAETVTASIMNTHVRDNLDYLYDPGDWATYTPTIANLSTSTYTANGYYQYLNRSTVIARITVTINTFAGTGTTAVTVTLPVNAKTTGMVAGATIMGDAIYVPTGVQAIEGRAVWNATGTFRVVLNDATPPNMSSWTLNAPAGQAANDVWSFLLTYEAA